MKSGRNPSDPQIQNLPGTLAYALEMSGVRRGPPPTEEDLRKQIERLRAALQEIADGCNEPDTYAKLVLDGTL